MAKVGRNEPCPCGSGKKFKRCHGSIEHLERIARVVAGAEKTRGRVQAAQVQRQRQQGLGRPIISAESNGYRLVAVKNRLHYSKNWKTFHDFLINYLKSVMSRDWGNAEIAKPTELRHPIVIWYQLLCEQQRLSIKEPGKVATGKMTNTPWSLYLEAPAPRCAALYEGFQIPDFKGGMLSPSLRHAIDAREAHIEMHELAESMRDHSSIPSTFDGDIPEFAFAPNTRRLLIGERYTLAARQGLVLPPGLIGLVLLGQGGGAAQACSARSSVSRM